MHNESTARAAVVAEARRWLGTPYHNCADVRGVGVDCGMLIVRVFVDTGLCAPFDPRPYPPDWHLHRKEERYLGFVFDRCAEVESPLIDGGDRAKPKAQPGDVMVFRYGRCYSHGGIVTALDPLRIVHAFHPAHSVVEQEVARDWQLADPRRAPRFFSYWGAR
jgi:cell wall-associated NlpC family hydrolase